MSDLTRYDPHTVATLHPNGEWVKADEAEARIKELEAQLRAAEQMAEAIESIERSDIPSWDARVTAGRALRAYREGEA